LECFDAQTVVVTFVDELGATLVKATIIEGLGYLLSVTVKRNAVATTERSSGVSKQGSYVKVVNVLCIVSDLLPHSVTRPETREVK
jgi:hypothetical protein